MKKNFLKLFSLILFCISIICLNVGYTYANENSSVTIKSYDITNDEYVTSTSYNIIDTSTGNILKFKKTSNNNYVVDFHGTIKDLSTTNGIIVVTGLNGEYSVVANNDDSKLYCDSTRKNITIYDIQGKNIEVVFNYEQSNGTALISLKSENGDVISNAEFVLKNDNNEIVQLVKKNGSYIYSKNGEITKLHTDGTGKINIEKLPIGKYQIIQVSTPSEYNGELAYNAFEIHNQIVTNIDLINTKEYGYVNINVVDLSNENEMLSGSMIQIKDELNNIVKFEQRETGYYYSENGEISEILIENGVIKLSDLPLGNYYLEELSSPKGYNKTENQYFNIAKNKETSIVLRNKKSIGTLLINISEKNSEKTIGDVYFELLSKTNNEKILFKYTNGKYEYNLNGNSNIKSNNNGQIKLINIPIGEYILKPIKIPTGYLNMTEDLFVKIENETEASINTSLMLSENLITFINTESTGIKNVQFEVVDENNNLIVNDFSNNNGSYMLPNMKKGTYTIKVISVPDTYEAYNNKIQLTVNDLGQIEDIQPIKLYYNKITVNVLKENVKVVLINRKTLEEMIQTSDNSNCVSFEKVPCGDYKILVDDDLTSFDGLSFELLPNTENTYLTLDIEYDMSSDEIKDIIIVAVVILLIAIGILTFTYLYVKQKRNKTFTKK